MDEPVGLSSWSSAIRELTQNRAMPAPPSPGSIPPLLTWLVLLPLIAWRMVVRVRRMTQRQRLGRWRPWITLTLFPLLLWMLAMTAYLPPHPQPERLVWLAAGLAAGGLVSLFGLKHTRFEHTDQGIFYTPNAKLGIALSLMFVGRVVYRLIELAVHGSAASQGPEFALSPWTLGPVGLFSGYYIVYACGLLWERWRARAEGSARRP